MFLIVVSHYIYHGLKTNPMHEAYDVTTTLGGANYLTLEPVWVISCVAVNCYVMITGYFLISSKSMRWNGILRTWVQVLFYSLFFLLCAVVMEIPVSRGDVLTSILPIYGREYWFVTDYIGLLCIAPFLSIMATEITQKQYKILLIMMFVLCFQFLYGNVYAGFDSLIWFSFLYLVAGYLRLYGVPQVWAKNSGKCLVIIWATLVVIATMMNLIKEPVFRLISSAYDGPIFFLSLALFVFFLNRSFNNRFCSLVVKIAPYTFGVYLIHENLFVSRQLWILVIPYEYDMPIIIHCILICMTIFAFCSIIDVVRAKLFSLLKIDDAVSYISGKLPRL